MPPNWKHSDLQLLLIRKILPGSLMPTFPGLKAIQNPRGKAGGVVVAIHLPTEHLPRQQWRDFFFCHQHGAGLADRLETLPPSCALTTAVAHIAVDWPALRLLL